jgi:hypothetical protein
MAYRDLPAVERIALYLIALGFAFGAGTHALDFVHFGWWPYRFGPPPLNVFWNALVGLDAAIVVLILAGLRTAGLTMASGVAAHRGSRVCGTGWCASGQWSGECDSENHALRSACA